ncbi:unnamed protein product, partial [marine sediment metagenome]
LNLSRSVEGIMKAKQKLLINILKNMPLGTSNCYFCLLNSPILGFDGCKTCQWGKFHGGTCCTPNNDYHKIQDLRLELQGAIEELYYKGEKYKTEEVEFKPESLI